MGYYNLCFKKYFFLDEHLPMIKQVNPRRPDVLVKAANKQKEHHSIHGSPEVVDTKKKDALTFYIQTWHWKNKKNKVFMVIFRKRVIKGFVNEILRRCFSLHSVKSSLSSSLLAPYKENL